MLVLSLSPHMAGTWHPNALGHWPTVVIQKLSLDSTVVLVNALKEGTTFGHSHIYIYIYIYINEVAQQ